MYYLGIDVGSRSCNAVLVDENAFVCAWHVMSTGAKNIEAIKNIVHCVIELAGILEEDIKATVSTGYGRNQVKQVKNCDRAVTEITCHAKGVRAVLKHTKILIDIGGQDSKVIALDNHGNVIDFAMNDKCAAGTGRFLEAMARVLQVDIQSMAKMDLGAVENLTLSSMCTVFAESEVISMIANGVELCEIVASMNRAISSRTFGLVKRVTENPANCFVSMSGGVAKNEGVVRALSRVLGRDVAIPNNPDTMGALGAALIARKNFG